MNIRGISVAFALAAMSVSATDYTWVGGTDGEWTTPSNWSPSGGYPNSASDVAKFAPSSATAVTVASEIEIKGIEVSGAGALTVTGKGITLGDGGISSTSSAALGISNDIAVASAATPLAVTGPAALSASTPAGPLHLGGIISGAGGLAKTGAGCLHLYRGNTFSGAFTANGTGRTPSGGDLTAWNYKLTGSGDVVIYDCGALGALSATFDAEATCKSDDTAGFGCRLVVATDGTISIPLELTGDYKNIGSVIVQNADVNFRTNVNCRYRLRAVVNGGKVNFYGNVEHSNYFMMSPYNGGELHMYTALKGSNRTNGDRHSTCHLHSQESSQAAMFMTDTPYVCEDANVLPRDLTYFCFERTNAVINLNGYDQLVSGFRAKDETCAPGGEVTTPKAKPASLKMTGCPVSGFKSAFTGAAGIEWTPKDGQDTTLYLSNAVSTTIGTFDVKGGRLMVTGTAGFTALGQLSVSGGATFEAEVSELPLFATNIVLGSSSSKLVLGRYRTLRCISATVDGVSLAPGAYVHGSQGVDIEGDGELVVLGSSRFWNGGMTGRWDDPNNWDGMVPAEGENAFIDGAANVFLTESTPRLRSLVIGKDATLTVSNWTTYINADSVQVDGRISCAGPFTNETAKSRVWIKCGDISVAKGGAIDVSKKGWNGGLWNGETEIHAVGYGPGSASANGRSAPSHGGCGGFNNVTSLPGSTYDDPYAPVEPGSGGTCPSRYGSDLPHCGGGAVRIEATGCVSVDGGILADGANASTANLDTQRHDTGASGGSVWISCKAINGSGIISANGGDGGAPVYPPMLLLANGNYPSDDSRIGHAAGGGMVKIQTSDVEAQTAADVDGLKISAAPGYYRDEKFGCDTLSTFDRYNTHAEPGTVVITDAALRGRLIGKGISGRLLDMESFHHDGDFVWSWGHVRFPAEGFSFEVTGDLTVESAESRLEIGNVCWTNMRCAVNDTWGGREVNRLSVGGDFTIAEGATVEIRAAETNAAMRWGAEVSVTGTMTVAGTLYASCDPVNLSVPHFSVGALDVPAGGLISSDRRGGAGGWDQPQIVSAMGNVVHKNGFGAETSSQAAGGSHGGIGGIGVGSDGAYVINGLASATVGNRFAPDAPGMGGSVYGYGEGGAGGGAIIIEAKSSITIDGTVSSDGWMSGYFSKYSGNDASSPEGYQCRVASGAGGTVYLSGSTVSGGGRISARGGDGANYANSASGCGGGGRVALWSGIENAAKYGTSGRCRIRRTGEAQEGCTYAGAIDVSGGTNVYARVGAATLERPASFGGSGTVGYGRIMPPVGMQIVVR